MKYIAVLDTDDYEDFEFFEDGNSKYLHAVDADATNGEWIYLPFKPLEQEPKSEWEQDHAILKAYSDGANEVLDKIRTEIEKLQKMCDKNDLNLMAQYSAFGMVLDILDKYKAESEE